MKIIPEKLKKIIEVFSNFPGVGERVATRFGLYLLSLDKKEREEIIKRISELNQIKRCPECFLPYEGESCPICSLPQRNKKILCVVEKEQDLWQIEEKGVFGGVYFILGGTLDFLKENPLGKMRIEALKEKVEKEKPEEIILALNPTHEGNLTMDYLEVLLKKYPVKISRLGRGLPTGGEVEYADKETLKSAFEGRK